MSLTHRRRVAQRNDDGASAVEYGLLIAAIAAMIVAVSFLLGSAVRGGFQNAVDAFDNAGSGSGGTTYNVANENGNGNGQGNENGNGNGHEAGPFGVGG